VAPSGRQVSLVFDDQEVIVVEVGGGLRSYVFGGRAVIDGYDEHEVCSAGRGQILAPWPNRLRDGRFSWNGRVMQGALSEPERSNAIHGLVRWLPWSVLEQSRSAARLACRLHPQPGWEWTLDLEVSYKLSECGLSVTTGATNRGPGKCPFGLGWHPYLAVPGASGILSSPGPPQGLVDALTLRLPASVALRSDERGLPTGTFSVEGTELDFRSGRQIGEARLDAAFTNLSRDDDGRAVVELWDAKSGHRPWLRLWVDHAYRWLMFYTGDGVEPLSRRRRGLAVEPMTCPPDMLNSGQDRIVLAEGESFEAAWGIEPGGR
jgi:aldose 1-epimerase